MILSVGAISDRTRSRLLADPPLVWRLIAPDDTEIYVSARAEARTKGWLSRLFRPKEEPPVPELALEDGEGLNGDVDKAWHGLHLLFTQTAWEGDHPANFLVAGGTSLEAIDAGYGPPRLFSTGETKDISRFLSSLDHSTLRTRFDPARMVALEIYPEIWMRPVDEDDSLSYLVEYFEPLKQIVSQAAARNHGLILVLS